MCINHMKLAIFFSIITLIFNLLLPENLSYEKIFTPAHFSYGYGGSVK